MTRPTHFLGVYCHTFFQCIVTGVTVVTGNFDKLQMYTHEGYFSDIPVTTVTLSQNHFSTRIIKQ